MDTNTELKYTTPVFKKDQPDDSYKFQPLPEPPGAYPYHLSLDSLVPFPNNQKLVFHIVTQKRRNSFFTWAILYTTLARLPIMLTSFSKLIITIRGQL